MPRCDTNCVLDADCGFTHQSRQMFTVLFLALLLVGIVPLSSQKTLVLIRQEGHVLEELWLQRLLKMSPMKRLGREPAGVFPRKLARLRSADRPLRRCYVLSLLTE